MTNPFQIVKNYGGSTANELTAMAQKNISIADGLCNQANISAQNGDLKNAGDFCLTAASAYFAARDLYEQVSRTDHADRDMYVQLAGQAFNSSVEATERAKSYYDSIDASNNPNVSTIPNSCASTFKKSSGFGTNELFFPILKGEDKIAKANAEKTGDKYAMNKDFDSAINSYLEAAQAHDEAIPEAKAKGDSETVAHHVNEAQRIRSKIIDLKVQQRAEGDVANEINKSTPSVFSTDALLYPLTKGDVAGHAFHGNQFTSGQSYGGRGSLKVGDRVRVSEGSGVDSNREGTVVHPSEVKTRGDGVPTNVEGAYKPVDWSRETAVRLDNGSLITMFNNRLSSAVSKDANESLETVMRHDQDHDNWHKMHGDAPCTSEADCAQKRAKYAEVKAEQSATKND